MAAFGQARQRGIALVLVLWILVLLTVTTGAFALMARMDQLEANQLLSGTQARMWAEAGLHLAAVRLRDPDDAERPVTDGRAYRTQMNGVIIETLITDERGKLDINMADEAMLETLFINNGLDPAQAGPLAAAVMDWRDDDDVERVDGAEAPTYESAGLAVIPANRDFMLPEELLQVIGMPYELFRKMEPGISVFSNTDLPELAYAPPEALMALADMSAEDAWNFVQNRRSTDMADLSAMTLPNGQPIMAQGRGLTYSIRVKATMPNGVWDQIEATIRLGGGPSGRPFRILRWKEGFQK
ncbi:general secretion pathway protein GspK [Marinihelvus fidelis]|uniref:General secretion pathway protein GspK n=1 Tax=Marinihelvus fidelis TaxID=2613842 RepID=A0A5N0T6Y7_9GAMM|nr:type II secretion system protein GspK [Marinihelvus fidelis]KAA9130770.1 general secretion pathway protein GspK [Marinihelvus fidelis]